MRLQKSPATSGSPSPGPGGNTPASSRTPRRKKHLWLALAVVGVVLAAWGAWSLWKPDPLREVHAALDRRDFATANDLLAKRLAERPDDSTAQLLAARSARRGGDFARAFDLLQQYREKNGATEAYTLESDLLRMQIGNLADADRLFESYSTQPESPDMPFVMEAYLEGSLKVYAPGHASRFNPETDDPTILPRLRKAASLWLTSRPGTADHIQGLIWEGRILRYSHDHEGGTNRFREVLALDPNHFDARLHLALALIQNSPEESMRHLELLHARRPDDRHLHYYLATGHRSFGRGAEARRLLNEMLATDGNDVSALLELGLLNLDEGKVSEAEPLLRKALALSPNISDTNVAMSRYAQLAGQPERAAEYRKRFEEIEAQRAKPTAPRP